MFRSPVAHDALDAFLFESRHNLHIHMLPPSNSEGMTYRRLRAYTEAIHSTCYNVICILCVPHVLQARGDGPSSMLCTHVCTSISIATPAITHLAGGTLERSPAVNTNVGPRCNVLYTGQA